MYCGAIKEAGIGEWDYNPEQECVPQIELPPSPFSTVVFTSGPPVSASSVSQPFLSHLF